MNKVRAIDLDDLAKKLDEYSCECGSGGPMSCHDDCGGRREDSVARDVLRELIVEIRHLRGEVIYE